MSNYKTISLNDFVAQGYLQEINRRFLHVLGLSLQVRKDECGNLIFDNIVDCRENENGISVKEGYLDKSKADNVDFEYNQKYLHRLSNLGYVVQPIKDIE